MQFENKVLSKEILFILYESGKTLATAESCTSGKVAESITLMPGASAYFTGGIVAYSEEVKKSLLNVPEELIEEKTGIHTITAEDPMSCVAIGTGKFIEYLNE